MPPLHRSPANRIVMFTTDRRIDRRILLEADSLEQAGWNVLIVAMPADASDAMAATADDPRVVRVGAAGIETRDAFIIRAYRWLRRWFVLNSPFMRRLRAVLWFALVNPERFFIRLFARAVADYPAAIYVAQSLATLPVAAAAVDRHGGRLVFDSHELHVEQEITRWEKRIWTDIERRYIGKCDAVITVNPSIAEELQRRYGLAKVHVVQNGEWTPETPPPKGRLFHAHFGLPKTAKILLYQGGIPAGRNLDVLITAMAFVRVPDLHLVLLGDGAAAASLSRLASGKGLADRVHFHPAVAQAALLEYTASADVGVIPYQPTCENNRLCTPNKLFEFTAAGLPMVATDLPELRRLIMDNQLGLVGDTASPHALAKLADEMFVNTGTLDRYRRGVLAARRKLSWQAESQFLLEVYANLGHPGETVGRKAHV